MTKILKDICLYFSTIISLVVFIILMAFFFFNDEKKEKKFEMLEDRDFF
jgi:hypothetical protein